eukprot:5985589-Heterocapsa_arctica.AAC.1
MLATISGRLSTLERHCRWRIFIHSPSSPSSRILSSRACAGSTATRGPPPALILAPTGPSG